MKYDVWGQYTKPMTAKSVNWLNTTLTLLSAHMGVEWELTHVLNMHSSCTSRKQTFKNSSVCQFVRQHSNCTAQWQSVTHLAKFAWKWWKIMTCLQRNAIPPDKSSSSWTKWVCASAAAQLTSTNSQILPHAHKHGNAIRAFFQTSARGAS